MSPTAPEDIPDHPADYNAISARLGWLPSIRNSTSIHWISVARQSRGARELDEQIISHVVEKLKKGEIKFAIEDPESPENFRE